MMKQTESLHASTTMKVTVSGGSAQKTKSFAFRLENDKYHCCEKLNRNEFKGAGWLWSNSDSVIFQSSLQIYRKIFKF